MKSISLLTPDDLNMAYAIEQRSHAFPWTKKTFLSNQGDRYLNYCINTDGHMAGFAITQIVLDEATLFNLAIDPAFRRRGLGRDLLAYLTDALSQRQVHTLWLEVRQSNQAAIALYEQQAFNAVSVRQNYYPTADGHEDAIIMALTL